MRIVKKIGDSITNSLRELRVHTDICEYPWPNKIFGLVESCYAVFIK